MMARILAALALIIGASQAWAQAYPNRPVKVIVAFAPATTSDIIGSTPEDTDRHLCDEVAKWGAVVRAANIKAE